MKASDVTDTLNMALQASGCDSARVVHKPRLLSDNGPSYVSADLASWLGDKGMEHVRGAPIHPQTQGKVERWHQSLKNRILLENNYLPGDFERQIEAFISHYNHLRCHEGIANLTPADIYFGRGQTILLERERIKHQTFKTRRLHHRGKPHNMKQQMRQSLHSIRLPKVHIYLTTDTPEEERALLARG